MKKKTMWNLIYAGTFAAAFIASAAFKVFWHPQNDKYNPHWDESTGTVYKDLSYGKEEANTFDLYIPADHSQKAYGLVVYLHAGGFTSGDKSDDAEMLEWLCSKGYVAAGINYTLRSEQNPQANILSQSQEIKESIPAIVAKAQELGYPLERMAMGGGSAGHCLAMLYAYRDAAASPVPVKMVFGAVGPSSFYPEDWSCYGFDKNPEAAAEMFSVMSGQTITPDLFGTPAYDQAIKQISPLLWINSNSVPSLMAYGQYDKVQPFVASRRLNEALDQYHVPHDYIVFPHSGHGLQNDNKQYELYMDKIDEYLDRYMKNPA